MQRAGLLVHLVEPEPADGADPLANYRAIREELRQYDAQLAERPEIIVITKADLPSAEAVRQRLSSDIDRPVCLISAVTGRGLDELVRAIVARMDQREATE